MGQTDGQQTRSSGVQRANGTDRRTANPQQRRAAREWDRQTDSKPAAAACSARMGQTDGQQTRSSGVQRANGTDRQGFGQVKEHTAAKMY